MWGYVVRAVLDELRDEDVHVIGLTATPPSDLTGAEDELYAELLGPVDFTVPTPAVVREGFLAPYQELAWLTEPLDSERAWLAEHDTRFKELITALHDDAEGPLSFPGWVINRMRERRRAADDDSQMAWEDFQHAQPALARAGVRFLGSARPGAARGRAARRVLPPAAGPRRLARAARGLRAALPARLPAPEAADRYSAVAAALAELGFKLTRRGIRRGTSEVDRLLTGSQAKALGLVEVLARRDGGARRRAAGAGAVRRRAGRGQARPAARRRARPGGGHGPPRADGARGRLAHGAAAAAGGLRAAGCAACPATPTCCSRRSSSRPTEHLALADWEAAPDGVLVSLRSSGAEWVPRAWVEVATRVLESGVCGTLIGTRALLGEGWDCPMVNCLVDLTVASTGVSVQQMRGRSLRLDPGDPEKLASNWDVVCVAPDLVRGSADYARFVRKHLHLYAPADDGEIEAGPSHVHPELGPFAPPPAGRLNELNRAMLARAGAAEEARERWRIGEPYRGADLRTLVVRPEGG